MNSNKAFTLAEVLITLTIIGVIAALTLPNLIAKYQKQQITVSLNKNYKVLSEALMKIESENPEFLDSINGTVAWSGLQNELEKYLKVYVHCDANTWQNKKCKRGTYHWLNGTTISSNGFIDRNYTILNDGTYIIYGNQGYFCGMHTSITIDANGIKAPNTWGKDTFTFVYNLNRNYPRRLIPYVYGVGIGNCAGLAYYSREDLTKDGEHGCTPKRTGLNCGALIMKDGWQMKDDYPW